MTPHAKKGFLKGKATRTIKTPAPHTAESLSRQPSASSLLTLSLDSKLPVDTEDTLDSEDALDSEDTPDSEDAPGSNDILGLDDVEDEIEDISS